MLFVEEKDLLVLVEGQADKAMYSIFAFSIGLARFQQSAACCLAVRGESSHPHCRLALDRAFFPLFQRISAWNLTKVHFSYRRRSSNKLESSY